MYPVTEGVFAWDLQFIISWIFSIDKMYNNVYRQLKAFYPCTKPNQTQPSQAHVIYVD